VERSKEKVSGAVAGEYPASAISAVSRRCETNDEKPRPRIAEAWQWPPPVFLEGESLDPDLGHFATPIPESRAPLAGNDFAAHAREGVGH